MFRLHRRWNGAGMIPVMTTAAVWLLLMMTPDAAMGARSKSVSRTKPATESGTTVVLAGNPCETIGPALQRLTARLRQRASAESVTPEEYEWIRQCLSELPTVLSNTTTDPVLLNRVYVAISTPPAGCVSEELETFRCIFVEWNRRRPLDEASLRLALTEAVPTFVPCCDLQLRDARAKLVHAIAQVDAQFSLNAETRDAKRATFGLDQLVAAMGIVDTAGDPLAGVDLQGLKDTLGNLELLPPAERTALYHTLFEQLARYTNLAQCRLEQETMRNEYEDIVAGIRAVFEMDPTLRDAKSSLDLGQWIWWLSASDQAPWIVGGIRNRYNHRNFYVDVSSDLINSFVRRPVNSVDDLRETVRGTSIRGTARTQGEMTASTQDSQTSLKVLLHFDGMVAADAVGVNGPATIHSSSATYIIADKPIWFDERGATTGPAVIRAGTRTQIHDVEAFGPIIQQIAEGQVEMEKSDAEYEASQRSAKRFAAELQKRVLETIGDLNERYVEVRHTWGEMRLLPDSLVIMSDRAGGQLQGRFASGTQVSPSPLPPILRDTSDLTVRIHQSAINNLLASMLTGAEIHKADMDAVRERLNVGNLDLSGLLDARNNDEGKSDESSEAGDWSILFPTARAPMEVKVEQLPKVVDGQPTGDMDQWIRFFIYGERYGRNRNGRSTGSAQPIIVSYKITTCGGRIVLLRDEKSLSSPRVIRVNVKEMFKEVITPNDMTYRPENGDGSPVTLRLVRLGVQNGWIIASWRRIPTPPEAEASPEPTPLAPILLSNAPAKVVPVKE